MESEGDILMAEKFDIKNTEVENMDCHVMLKDTLTKEMIK